MNKKIGVLDSGIGGTTVLDKMVELLPNEEYVYYKDTKNYPVLQLYSSIIIIQNYDLLRNCCKPEFAYFTGTSFRIYAFAFIKNSFPIFGHLHSYTCFFV